MKRFSGPLFVFLFCVLGSVLLVQMIERKRPVVIQVASGKSILNLPPEWEKDILNGSLKIALPGPKSVCLVRIESGNPSRLTDILNRSAEGKIMVVNPASIAVDPIEFDANTRSTLRAVEVNIGGNVYALAIKDEGV